MEGRKNEMEVGVGGRVQEEEESNDLSNHGSSNNVRDSSKHRPRRVEADVLAYLQQVTGMLRSRKTSSKHNAKNSSHGEKNKGTDQNDESSNENEKNGDDEEDNDNTDTELLLWNVLEELATCSASAASDRHASEPVEICLEKCSAQQIRFLMMGFQGYYSHLWTNRYSSHVLQRILAMSRDILCHEVETKQTEKSHEDDDAHPNVPTMTKLIADMCEELSSEWLNFVCDISASHVLRSTLCILSGRSIPQEKRGKKAKHRAVHLTKYKSDSSHAETLVTVPSCFESQLDFILESISSSSKENLQEIACDTHGGPIISLMIRIVSAKQREALVSKMLEWTDEEASKNALYNFAGHPVGSHMLEAVFDTCSDEFFESLYNRCFSGNLLEYSQHHVANYVVQHAIARFHDSKLLNKAMTELKAHVFELLSIGRPGILWKLAESSAKLKACQEEALDSIQRAAKAQEAQKPEGTRRGFVPSLISLRLPNEQNPRLWLDVPCAQIVKNLLGFEPPYQKIVLESILKMSSDELVALAKDSSGSRCIIEPIWEDAKEALEWAHLALYEKMKGFWVALAMDRCGAFSTMKAFERLPVKSKISLVEELLKSETKLNGCHFGSLVLKTCQVHEFKTNRAKWIKSFDKKGKSVEILQELITDSEAHENASSMKESKKMKKSKKDKTKKESLKRKSDNPVDEILNQLLPTSKTTKKEKKLKKAKRDTSGATPDFDFVFNALKEG